MVELEATCMQIANTRHLVRNRVKKKPSLLQRQIPGCRGAIRVHYLLAWSQMHARSCSYFLCLVCNTCVVFSISASAPASACAQGPSPHTASGRSAAGSCHRQGYLTGTIHYFILFLLLDLFYEYFRSSNQYGSHLRKGAFNAI